MDLKKYNLDNWRNRLIVFEGIDRTGKTSVAKAIAKLLNDNGVETAFTFQPGDIEWGPLASTMRSLCKDKRWNLHPLSNFFAFQLDRVEVTDKVIVPALEAGKTVISDRWNYSTYAYQMHGKQLIKEHDIPEEVLSWLMETAITSKDPDIVFYFPEKLDVDRVDDTNDEFDHESDTFMSRVDSAYEELYEKNKDTWIKVTPGKSVEETVNTVLGLMELYCVRKN